MTRHFYGTALIVLGLWETAAYATRGRIPTITSTARSCRRKRALLLLYLAGAAVHIARKPNPSTEG